MRAARRDQNESAIVAALRKCGCRVRREDWVDLVVQRGRHTFLLEVKMPDGKPTKLQEQLKADGWKITTVRTADEAVEAVAHT